LPIRTRYLFNIESYVKYREKRENANAKSNMSANRKKTKWEEQEEEENNKKKNNNK